MNNNQGSSGNVIAAICSLFITGLGQLVQGRWLAASIYFALNLALWPLSFLFHFPLVIILWVECIVDAARYNPNKYE